MAGSKKIQAKQGNARSLVDIGSTGEQLMAAGDQAGGRSAIDALTGTVANTPQSGIYVIEATSDVGTGIITFDLTDGTQCPVLASAKLLCGIGTLHNDPVAVTPEAETVAAFQVKCWGLDGNAAPGKPVRFAVIGIVA